MPDRRRRTAPPGRRLEGDEPLGGDLLLQSEVHGIQDRFGVVPVAVVFGHELEQLSARQEADQIRRTVVVVVLPQPLLRGTVNGQLAAGGPGETEHQVLVVARQLARLGVEGDEDAGPAQGVS